MRLADRLYTNEGVHVVPTASAASVVPMDTPSANAQPPAIVVPVDSSPLAPWVSAGVDQTILLADSSRLPVTVAVTGVVSPVAGGDFDVMWSQASGPRPVGFLGSRSLEATVALNAPGDYVLRLSAASGDTVESSEVRITVSLGQEHAARDIGSRSRSPGIGEPVASPGGRWEAIGEAEDSAVPAPAAAGNLPTLQAVDGFRFDSLEPQVFEAVVPPVVAPESPGDTESPEEAVGESHQIAGRNLYVAPEGNDSDPGTVDAPYRTLREALAATGPGDTVFVREGIYAQGIHSRSDGVPSGASFDDAVTVRGYPGETVVLQPVGGLAVLYLAGPVRYTIWRDLVIDGSLLSYPGANGIELRDSADYNRFQNLEVRNVAGSGVYVSAEGGNTHNEFVDMNVHEVALGPDGEGHGIHVQSSDNLIDGGDWHGIDGKAGNSSAIRIDNGGRGADRNVVRNARIYENQFGISFGSGSGNMVYNNLVYDNLNMAVGIDFGDASDGNSFLNNTVVGNAGLAVGIGDVGVLTNTRVVNNVFWANGIDAIADSGVGTLVRSNLFLDPLFLDGEARDFRLSPLSPAVDAGATLVEIATDSDGVPRPQGSAFDIGAHEYPGHVR